MMVHCCTGLDLDRQDAPFFNDQQIGVQRGEVGRAFEIEVCPARERVDGERALSALAWACEEHGRKRVEEEPKAIGLLPLEIFNTVRFCMLGSKIQGMEIEWRLDALGCMHGVRQEKSVHRGGSSEEGGRGAVASVQGRRVLYRRSYWKFIRQLL